MPNYDTNSINLPNTRTQTIILDGSSGVDKGIPLIDQMSIVFLVKSNLINVNLYDFLPYNFVLIQVSFKVLVK